VRFSCLGVVAAASSQTPRGSFPMSRLNTF
jgi:hypothetical protein